jgi:hypothetical protein
MTKSQSQQQDQRQEVEWAELLLRRFHKAAEVFEKAREYNRSHGIDENLSKRYINYSKPLEQRKIERFLNRVTNVDTNEWNTMTYLKATNQVARGIETEYDNVKYPRIELYQLYRIKTRSSNQEFLKRRIMIYGLGNNGKEIGISVDLDFEQIPSIEYVPLTETIQAGSEYEESGYGRRTIAKVSNDNGIYSGIETAKVTYVTPFSVETVQDFIKDARGGFTDPDGTSLVFKDENKSHRCSIKSLEQFCNPSFDQVMTEVSRKEPSIDVKDLIRQLKTEDIIGKDADKKQPPYQ